MQNYGVPTFDFIVHLLFLYCIMFVIVILIPFFGKRN